MRDVPLAIEPANARVAKLRWLWSIVVIVPLVAAGLYWGGSRWREVRLYQNAISEIETEIDEGRYGLATRKLGELLSWRPDSDQAAYLLGLCEERRGRPDAANTAWAGVPPKSPFFPKAILGQLERLIERGRLAQAEQLVEDSGHFVSGLGSGPDILLGPVFCQEGRLDEALRLIEARWNHLNRAGEGASEKAINLVRLHIELTTMPTAGASARAFLDQAGRSEPADDRIWLGQANVAIGAGELDKAARLLDQCLERRPEDFPVWRARLKWAMAVGNLKKAQEALVRLPAAEATAAEIRKIEAWLAAKRGDLGSEERALDRALSEDPADAAARTRLIELARASKRAARVSELERQQAEVERALARYRKLYRRNQPARDAEEMARLAQELGRWFEARAFLTAALAANPERSELRGDLGFLTRRSDVTGELGRTLSGVLSSDLDIVLPLEPLPSADQPVRNPPRAKATETAPRTQN
jgi:enediyne biosynthesis protein E4